MMTPLNKILSTLAVLLAISSPGLAHAHPMPVAKAGSPEFGQVKQLVGTWKGRMVHSDPKEPQGDPVFTTFKLTAAGSAVEETLMTGTPHEMVDMYTDENGKLAMTHYCAMGNQPRMKLSPSAPGSIRLEMVPTPGIDSAKDVHMHGLTLEFVDANHLVERWTSYENGKPSGTSVFTFTRSQ